MKKDFINFQVDKNTLLSGRVWKNENIGEPKGVIIIVHGMAEHIDRYDGFAHALTENGFIVYGYNQRGHKGSVASDDDIGYISDTDGFKDLVSDLREVFMGLKERHPDLPFFMFGHSMGSFVQLRYAQLYPADYNGLILSGSAMNPNVLLCVGRFFSKISVMIKGRKYRSRFLNDFVYRTSNNKFKPNRTDFDWLNSLDDEVDKYVEDPHCGGQFTNSFYLDFFNGLIQINKNYKKIQKTLPILILSGSLDPVGGESKLVTKLFKKLEKEQIGDLTIKLYDGARHEILLEKQSDEVKSDILNWMNKHTTI